MSFKSALGIPKGIPIVSAVIFTASAGVADHAGALACQILPDSSVAGFPRSLSLHQVAWPERRLVASGALLWKGAP